MSLVFLSVQNEDFEQKKERKTNKGFSLQDIWLFFKALNGAAHI
jgi:hypothetical protein